jgi:hypothetical protein
MKFKRFLKRRNNAKYLEGKMSRLCTTHHHACDCREEMFKEIEAQNKILREAVDKYGKEIERLMNLCTTYENDLGLNDE